MVLELAAMLAVARWELRRLAPWFAAFAIIDSALFAFNGANQSALASHHLCALALAVTLGSLSAANAAEKANFEFLLAHRISRTGIWGSSSLVCLALLLAFISIPHWLVGQGAATSAMHSLMACFLAAAIASMSGKAVRGFLATILILAILSAVSAVLDQSRTPSAGVKLLFHFVVANCAMVISWLGLLAHGHRLARGRFVVSTTAIGATALVLAVFFVMTAITVSSREAVEELLESGSAFMAHERFGFPRESLRKELLAARATAIVQSPNDERIALLHVALARIGDQSGIDGAAMRVRSLAKEERAPNAVDLAAIQCVALAGPGPETVEAIFQLLLRAVGDESVNERAFRQTIMQAAGILDRDRAGKIVAPFLNDLGRTGQFGELRIHILQQGFDGATSVDYRRFLAPELFDLALQHLEANPNASSIAAIVIASPRAETRRAFAKLWISMRTFLESRTRWRSFSLESCELGEIVEVAQEEFRSHSQTTATSSIASRDRLSAALGVLVECGDHSDIDLELIGKHFELPANRMDWSWHSTFRGLDMRFNQLLALANPVSLKVAALQAEHFGVLADRKIALAYAGDLDARQWIAREIRAEPLRKLGTDLPPPPPGETYLDRDLRYIAALDLLAIAPELESRVIAAHDQPPTQSRLADAARIARQGHRSGMALLIDAALDHPELQVHGIPICYFVTRVLTESTGKHLGNDPEVWRQAMR